jgi:pimeloyl-ACP methyl ester carboxylesterase
MFKCFEKYKKNLDFGFYNADIKCGGDSCERFFLTHTPQIKDENGNFVEGAIAELKALRFLNGRKQWVSIRGWNPNNPLLLFLAGGPGGTQMAAVRHELAELEKHFVVVNWDQPGSGKSYNTLKTSKITVDTYLEDGYALTEYLKMRFKQEKIYLMGESWGSALGIFFA